MRAGSSPLDSGSPFLGNRAGSRSPRGSHSLSLRSQPSAGMRDLLAGTRPDFLRPDMNHTGFLLSHFLFSERGRGKTPDQNGDFSLNATASPPSLVPTLRVGMPSSTLRAVRAARRNAGDAERPGMHSHAERGNEFKRFSSSVLCLGNRGCKIAGMVRDVGRTFLSDHREPRPPKDGQECPSYLRQARPCTLSGAHKRWCLARSLINSGMVSPDSLGFPQPASRCPLPTVHCPPPTADKPQITSHWRPRPLYWLVRNLW